MAAINPAIQEFSQWTYTNTGHLFENLETYVRVVNVYDGDTCTVIFKVGQAYYKHNIRLFGIDTCEIRSKNEEQKQKALQAKNRLIELVSGTKLVPNYTKKQLLELLNSQVYLVFAKIHGLDKYGRLLCELYSANNLSANNLSANNLPANNLPANNLPANNLPANKSFSDILLAENLAYAYGGGTKQIDFGESGLN
jgi:endonuclease YncB( thermonuclease family)